MSKRIHVVPGNGGWAVKREGSSSPISQHRTQEKAINAGRPIARREETELVTHRRDGRIRDSDSFGSESAASKDKKH